MWLQFPVSSLEEFNALIHEGAIRRATHSTSVNTSSSRCCVKMTVFHLSIRVFPPSSSCTVGGVGCYRRSVLCV
jgi:hypothetical protein